MYQNYMSNGFIECYDVFPIFFYKFSTGDVMLAQSLKMPKNMGSTPLDAQSFSLRKICKCYHFTDKK